MEQDPVMLSRELQNQIGAWVRARSYKGRDATNLQCRMALEGKGREVLFGVTRNKMWKCVEWLPSLSCLDPEVHHMAHAVALEAGDVTPPYSLIFGNSIRILAGDARYSFPEIKSTTDITSAFQDFCTTFERAEAFFLKHTRTRRATLDSLIDPEVTSRLCLITTHLREVKIAHMLLLSCNKKTVLDTLELYDQEPDDWKSAGLVSPFSKFRKIVLDKYLA
jgi:hypothetical protein